MARGLTSTGSPLPAHRQKNVYCSTIEEQRRWRGVYGPPIPCPRMRARGHNDGRAACQSSCENRSSIRGSIPCKFCVPQAPRNHLISRTFCRAPQFLRAPCIDHGTVTSANPTIYDRDGRARPLRFPHPGHDNCARRLSFLGLPQMKPSALVLAQLRCRNRRPNVCRNFSAPARLTAEHFLDWIRSGKKSATGINHARTVVSTLERADAAHAGHLR
jgi:hypothetical protein